MIGFIPRGSEIRTVVTVLACGTDFLSVTVTYSYKINPEVVLQNNDEIAQRSNDMFWKQIFGISV